MNRVLASCAIVLAAMWYSLSTLPPSASDLTDRQRDDHAIVEIVLSDLTTRDYIGLAHGEDIPRRIYVLTRLPKYVGDVDGQLRDNEGQPDISDRSDITEAIKNLTERHANQDDLSTYHPRNRLVRMVKPAPARAPVIYSDWYMDFMLTDFGMRLRQYWNMTPFARDYSADFPIEVVTPGYSEDGKSAVIWIYCSELEPIRKPSR